MITVIESDLHIRQVSNFQEAKKEQTFYNVFA